jgi:hypothetical protein
MKANTLISGITALLVLFLAGAAFVLSYDALRDLALGNGVKPGLAWLWPLMLDAFMIAASLAVLRANLYAERSWYPWLLVGAFTLASITFNVVHAVDALLPQAIAALPPAVVFLAFELVMNQTKLTVKRQSVMLSLSVLEQQAETKRQEVDTLANEVATLTVKRDTLRTELSELHQEKRVSNLDNLNSANAARALGKVAALNALVAYLADHPGASLAKAGRAIGRSKTTVAGYLDELEAAGRISRNGNRVKVLEG